MATFEPYLDQDFEKLKASALKSGKLFEDDKFSASDSSIYRFRNFYGRQIFWKRPHEIVSDPKFIVDHIVPNDLDQGQIGNCWMIAAAASVLNVPEYLKRNIPDNQNFDKGNYAGIFHFRFWLNGEWVDVVVDDKIPVNQNNQIIFCKNLVDKNEMFGPLLEKAYAKINVCYEFLVGGNSKNAMIDFTGGVNERYELTRCLPSAGNERYINPNILWELMFRSIHLKALLSCAADVNKNQKMEQETQNGLVVGHAYTILALYEIIKVNGQFNEFRKKDQTTDPNQTIRLLLIRNPWGKVSSYKGPWSKGAKEWKQVGSKIISELNPDNKIDGEFYMGFDDYYKFFSNMDTVHVDMDGLADSKKSNQKDLEWNLTQIHGEWIVGKNAGGCQNDQTFYWTNPQHTFKINNTKDQSAVIISLMQKDSSNNRMKTGGSSNGIYEALGFYVYLINNGAKPDSSGRYDRSNLILKNRIGTFMYQKEVSKRIELDPGDYVVVPCCFEKNKGASYLLRLYMETVKINNLNQTAKITKPEEAKIKQISENDSKLKDLNNKNSKTVKLKIPTRGEMYEKWYFSGMNQKEIENLQKQAQTASSKACLVM